MLKQTFEWELVDPKTWSNHPGELGMYVENPWLNKEYWNEAKLKEELVQLKKFAGEFGRTLTELLEEIIPSGTIAKVCERVKLVYNFKSVQDLYETWMLAVTMCTNYCRHHIHQSESYVGCTVHKEGKVVFGSVRYGKDERIFSCPYENYMESIQPNQKNCSDFKAGSRT